MTQQCLDATGSREWIVVGVGSPSLNLTVTRTTRKTKNTWLSGTLVKLRTKNKEAHLLTFYTNP
jgi:hypothetical protein